MITADTVGELEIKVHNSQNTANLWVQENGPQLAMHKTEVILIINRLLFRHNYSWRGKNRVELSTVVPESAVLVLTSIRLIGLLAPSSPEGSV